MKKVLDRQLKFLHISCHLHNRLLDVAGVVQEFQVLVKDLLYDQVLA